MDIYELEKNNDLIAEFMGLKKSDSLCKGSFTFIGEDIKNAGLPFIGGIMGNCMDELPFNSSWDWLMPVLDRIEKKANFETKLEFFVGSYLKNAKFVKLTIFSEANIVYEYEGIGYSTKIDAVYMAVVGFIKWYNQNKKS